jgi:hypothetical protein
MSENDQPGRHLSTAQRSALDALHRGASKHQAGIIANRTERTINRWIADDERFQEALKQSTTIAVDDASRRLAGLLDDSIEVIVGIMGDGGISAHIRLRAAEIVISNTMRLIEFQQLEERIAALEGQISNVRY